MFQQQQGGVTFQIPADKTGLIIGSKGATVKKIQSTFGVVCKIPTKAEMKGPHATITITGRDPAGAQAQIQQIVGGAKPLQNATSPGGFGAAAGGASSLVALCQSSEPHGPSKQQGDQCPASVTGLLLHGDNLYSSGKDGQILVWALNGTQLGKVNAVPCPGPAFSLLAESGWLFAGQEGGISCWNLQSGLQQNLQHPPGAVMALCAVPHPQAGMLLLSGGADGSIRMWKLGATAQWEGVSELQGHSRPVRDIQVWSTNPTPMVVSCSGGGGDPSGADVRLWNLEAACLQTMADHQHWVMSCTPMTLPSGQHAGQYLCTGSLDGTVKVYKTGASSFEGILDHNVSAVVGQPLDSCRVTCVIMTADPSGTPVLATALTGGVLIVWDVPGFSERCRATECGNPNGGMMGEVVVLSQVPGKMVMAGGADGYIKIWQWS